MARRRSRIEELNLLLKQLAEWGNLESQADTSDVSSLSDFYRARYLYRLSHGGEAAEAGLAVFVQTLEHGEAAPRGAPPAIRERAEARAVLAQQVAHEIAVARALLATVRRIRLSELGRVEPQAFGLFLTLLSEALAEQTGPEATVECTSGDGLSHIRLEPLGVETHAEIVTALGVFAGRDHFITISPLTYAP